MTGIFEWSETAAANASADSEINWSEGQPANTVNNSARAMMRRIRQLLDDQFGALVTGGTGNDYTVTTKSQIVTLRDGFGFVVRANRTCTGACTMNPDGKGSLPWRDERGNELQSGDIVSEGYYPVYYHSADTTYRTRLQASRSNPHGGAVLEYTDASTITLKPKQDGFLRVGGAAKSIPAGGITGVATGKQTPLTSTNSAITASVATLTLGATHAFVVGQKVLVVATYNAGRSNSIAGLKTLTAVTGTTISFAVSTTTLASGADTAYTVYGIFYAYAYDANSDGVLDTLELSPTDHTTDAYGVEVKSGDPTRVLVGLVGIDSSGGTPVFSDGLQKRFVRSFYNRPRQALFGKRTGAAATSSSVPIEVTPSEMRSIFLTFADDVVVFDQAGEIFNNGAGGTAVVGYTSDGQIEQNSSCRHSILGIVPVSTPLRVQMAEGMHSVGVYVTITGGGSVTLGPSTEDTATGRHFNTVTGAVI
jgi:hypothetical protein